MHVSTEVKRYKASSSGAMYLPNGILTWSVPDPQAPDVSPVHQWAVQASYDSRSLPRDVEPPTVAGLQSYAEARTNAENVSRAIEFVASHLPVASAHSEVPTVRLKRVLDAVQRGTGVEVSPLELTAALVHVGHAVDLRRDLANPHTSVPVLALEWAHAKVTRSPLTASAHHVSTWLEHTVVCDENILCTLEVHRVNSGGYSQTPRTESTPALVAEIQRIVDVLVDIFPAARIPRCREARGYFPGSYGLKHVIERLAGVYVSNGNLILAAALAGYPVEAEDGINAVIGIDPLLYDLLYAKANAARWM